MEKDYPEPSASGVSTTGDELDNLLEFAEQSNRPSDIPIQTQSIKAWHPILDPNWVIFSYLLLAVIMIPFGKCVAVTESTITTTSFVDTHPKRTSNQILFYP